MKREFIAIIMVMASLPYATAAQLDASIESGSEFIRPTFQFLRVIYIEYPEGGEISEEMNGLKKEVHFVADNSTPGMEEFVSNLNQKLAKVPSNSIVTDAEITYQAILQGNEKNAVIEYKIQVTPTITNYIISKTSDTSRIDANWRGIATDSQILLQTEHGVFDINNSLDALETMIPNVAKKLSTVSILEIPLIDATGIQHLPLDKWHSLFDNTAVIASAAEWNYTGNLTTHYSMGECNIGIGQCNDREWTEEIKLDKDYTIRMIESRDDATIAIEGYVDSTHFNGIEIFETNRKQIVTQKPDTDAFPSTIIYGMAGIAAVAGIAIFIISDRKTKRDKDEGQTGIDPACLRAYETSSSSGSYKTNRGESYLSTLEKTKAPI